VVALLVLLPILQVVIVPEGTTWKGLSVYNYNYIGDERPRRGVMAQQVETMYPDAVTTIDGVKHVNYGAI
jgi:hypothetical protein